MEITDNPADTDVNNGARRGVDTSSLDYHSRPLSYNDYNNFRSYKNRQDSNGAVEPSNNLHSIGLDMINFKMCYNACDADKITEFFGNDISYYLELFFVSDNRYDTFIIDSGSEKRNFFLNWLSKNIYSIDTSKFTDDLAGYIFSRSHNFWNRDISSPSVSEVHMYISELSTLLNDLDFLDSSVRSFDQTQTNFTLGSVYNSLKFYMKQSTDNIINVSSLIDMIDNNKKRHVMPIAFVDLLILLETIDAVSKYKDRIKETLENFSDSYNKGQMFGNPDGQTHTLQRIYEKLGGKNELFPAKELTGQKYLRLGTVSNP